MTVTGWDEFWWTNITGPNALVTQVADALLEKNIVVLQVPSDLPWRHQMRACVESVLKTRSLAEPVAVYSVDAEDDCGDKAPGKFLLDQYAPKEVRHNYRERRDETVYSYLSQNGVFAGKIFWVKGLDTRSAEEWLRFCKSGPSAPRGGRFLLEISESVPVQESKKIRILKFSSFVSNYDLQLFNTFRLSAAGGYSHLWNQYVSVLAAKLCGVDAELSDSLIRCVDFRREEPLDGLRRVAELPEFSRRGADKDGDHALSLLRQGRIHELNMRVWSAQVQVLFPVIELERAEIVETWWEPLENALTRAEITWFKQKLESPLDFELAAIVHYTSKDPIIDIPDENAKKRIYFVYTCRNLIAHMNCCSCGQIGKLFLKDGGQG